MNSLRLTSPLFTDPLEAAMRRIFSSSALDSDLFSARMPLDVAERDGMYEVKADLPGVRKEDIHVRIDGNLVQIEAQTNQGKDPKTSLDRILRNERYHGTISRSFHMDSEIDSAKVEARFSDGVLTLELPKQLTSSMRKIVIQ